MYNRKVSTLNLTDIKAVAFDIDGTLYRAWKFNFRMIPYYVRHSIFFLHYGLVRNIMHKSDVTPDFFKVQGSHMAKKLRCSTEEAVARLDRIVYKGFEKTFQKVKPCDGAVELIKKLKENGYKIALLSDFPPEQKGDIWGIREMCDVMLGSEEAGALKPSSTPFLKMAEKLELKPEQILYVGNSHKYDVTGSKNVGMKSAWFVKPSARWFKKKSSKADIIFWDYSQLNDIFFNNNYNNSEKTSD